MRKLKHIVVVFLLTVAQILIQSCIHTYPDGDGNDPTLIQVALEPEISLSWDVVQHPTKGSEDVSQSDMCRRVTVEFFRNDKSCGRCERVLTQAEYAAGKIRMVMPFALHAVDYHVAAWIDCESNDTSRPYSYDVSDLLRVSRVDGQIAWRHELECGYCYAKISLQKYRDKWNSRVVIPIVLSNPLCRIGFRATDFSKFTEYVSDNILQGETYSVCLSFGGRVGGAFDLVMDEPCHYKEKPEYYFPLNLDDAAMGNLDFGESSFFIGEGVRNMAVSVIVYNSARVIVSKSPMIDIPVARGKKTVMTGNFLTNYFSNDINVNNIWDGEIIVEI